MSEVHVTASGGEAPHDPRVTGDLATDRSLFELVLAIRAVAQDRDRLFNNLYGDHMTRAARLQTALRQALPLLEEWHTELNLDGLTPDDPVTVWEVCKVCGCRYGGHIENCTFAALLAEIKALLA